MEKSMRLTTSALALAVGFGLTAPAFAGPEFEPRGRFHLDYGTISEDEEEFSDEFFNRRTRLGVGGTLDDNWDFRIEYDFARNGTSANDVRLRRSFDSGRLWLGQFKVPMGLNELTSSNNITFIERSAANNMVAISRRIGIGWHSFQEHFGYQVMAFGHSIGDEGSANGDMPIGLGGRVVFNPMRTQDQMVHLGASLAIEDTDDSDTAGGPSVRAEARPGNPRFINVGPISDVNDLTRFGLEAAYQSGPFSLEAEYLAIEYGRSGASDATFDGFHIQGSYILTGESRSYGGGSFGGVTPSGDGGAWELAARFSSVDASDSGIEGGEQDNFTIGANYYISSNLRFMGNLIFVDFEDTATGDSDEPTIALFRAQYNF